MSTRSSTPATGAMVTGALPKPMSNIEFLRSLALACLALALSAIILLTGYIIYSPELTKYESVVSSNDITPRKVQGGDLVVRLGTGEASGNKELRLTGLDQGIDNRAILTSRTSLAASDYPFVEYEIRNRTAAENIYLIWRTVENPEKVSNIALHWNGDKTATAHPGRHKEWKGRISEIGLDVYGDLRDEPLIISDLTLLPASSRTLFSTIWSEWTAFRGWTQKSAHHLRGVPKHSILSPTLAMATWVGLAFVLLGCRHLFLQSNNYMAYVIAIFVPWLALDLLWQSNLSTQLEETKYLFAGKTQHEKHLSDRDNELYQYAKHLKTEILPEPGARVFLLEDTPHRTYKRLKLQYYLLPHNIYNYDRFPQQKAIHDGDYILVLGEIDGLEYDSGSQTLNWSNKTLKVKQTDTHALGNIYQVTPLDN
jgi:hypothetical protein